MFRAFIDRPVLTSSIMLLIVMAGVIGLLTLPVSQYPPLTPPIVEVSCSYPGADADTVRQAVAVPLEQQLNGTPNMVYMSSNCASDGRLRIQITFDADADPDISAVDVQNRVKLAESKLPAEVRRLGIDVKKVAAALLMIIAVHSDQERYDYAYLSNFGTINIMDFIRRVPGVGIVSNIATRYYSMRIWLDPIKMNALNITVADIRNAIREQNAEAGMGTAGLQPVEGTQIVTPLRTRGRLQSAQEFEKIVLRSTPEGSVVLLKDVAEVKLGSSDYNRTSMFDGTEAAALSVSLLPQANPVSTARAIRRTLEENSKNFPKGVQYSILYDNGRNVEAWIFSAVKNLGAAVAIALVVVGVLLRRIRLMVIPVFIIPVTLLGVFAVMGLFDISINMLSLFGLIFAIGFILYDIIIIVHATHKSIEQKGVDIKEAASGTIKSQAGTIIATNIMLTAVFIVVGFMGGIPGRLFRAFSYTLAICVIISTMISLTLTPALCGFFLKKQSGSISGLSGKLSRPNLFSKLVAAFARVPAIGALTVVIILAAGFAVYRDVPTAFLPEEDQGYILTEFELPNGAAFSRTSRMMDKADDYFRSLPTVQHVLSLKGISVRVGTIDSRGHFLVVLKPSSERRDPKKSAKAIMEKARIDVDHPEAITYLMNPPTIPGLGGGGGFFLILQERTGRNWEGLVQFTEELLQRCSECPILRDLATDLQTDVPQVWVEVDKMKAKTLGVSLTNIYSTVRALLSSSYVNDFNLLNRVYRVKIQAQTSYRDHPEDISNFYVRGRNNAMVPIESLVTIRKISGPGAKGRYNMFDAAGIFGIPRPGYSSGDAMAEVERILGEIMPPGFGYEWTAISYEEKKAAGQIGPILIVVGCVVILLLAARFENWLAPLAVLPMLLVAFAGAVVALWLTGVENGLYFQISIVALMGLTLKQTSVSIAAMIDLYRNGESPSSAAINGMQSQVKPLLISSFAFIPALFPLILARGAGAGSQGAIATGAFGGLLTVTVTGVLLVPSCFCLIFMLKETLWKRMHTNTNRMEAGNS
ncbi:MAG: efflux RND transporter permease subunit [Planctomycetota bacterium]|jgi:hydrophobe/amphiphile efflux-1 (HAE1) family protein